MAFAASPSTRTVYDATLKNGFTIHHLRQEANGDQTRLFTSETDYVDIPTSEIAEITSSEEPIAPEVKPQPTLNEIVNAASDKHQIDADLINSVIHAESAFNPKARSPKGALGLMQLMPSTATQLGVKDAYDPAANVDAGTHFLHELLVKYNGDMIKALAAYNAGPGRVRQFNGVPPYHETRTYVARIVKEFNEKKLAQQKAAKTASTRTTKTKTGDSSKGQ
jgi:soluble lytic murein transglycosylase-like protein